MRTCILTFFAFFLLLAGCRNNNTIPQHILPEPKMVAVMWDLIRVDQYLSNYVFIKDSSLNRKMESIKRYRQVLLLHNTTKEQFQESLAFYRARPQLLKTILDSLNVYKNNITTGLTGPKSTKDSAIDLKKVQP